MTFKKSDTLLNSEQVSKMLGYKTKTSFLQSLYKNALDIPRYKVGKFWLFSEADVCDWIESKKSEVQNG